MRPSRDLIILIALLLLVHAALAGAGWWMQKHYLVASPHLYWGLVAIPALSVWYVWRRNRRVPRATLPTVRSFVQGPFD